MLTRQGNETFPIGSLIREAMPSPLCSSCIHAPDNCRKSVKFFGHKNKAGFFVVTECNGYEKLEVAHV